MADALDLILNHVEWLLGYPDWLPMERCKILFYHDKLRIRSSLSAWNLMIGWRKYMKEITRNEFISLGQFIWEDVDQIGDLVTDIPEQKKESITGQEFRIYGAPVLSNVGQRLRYIFQLLKLCEL